MKQSDYIKIEYSCLESKLFLDDKYDKFHAWIDLINLAENASKSLRLNGIDIDLEQGELATSVRVLAKRWGWGKTKVCSFLNDLEQSGKISVRTTKAASIIRIADYQSYILTETPQRTHQRTRKYTDNQDVNNTPETPQRTPQRIPQFYETPQRTRKYTDNQDVNNTPETPQRTPQKQNKETEQETKKEKLSPVPPIKETNKEKEKEMGLRTREESNFVLTPETPAEEKKPTKKNSEEEYTLTYRARLTFDDFYKSKYGEAYYFSKKDMKMLSELLKKIKYSRTERARPLSVDDDSLLSAFKELLSMIQMKWIIENFSISNITSKYNEIVQDIKNNRNGKSNCTTEQERNRLDSERQRAAIMANVKKLDEQREQWIKAGKPESPKSERQLPGYDPFDFL